VRFLADANVLSEATKPQPNSSVLRWLVRHQAVLAVNPIVIGELQYGIMLLPSGKKRARLQSWFAAGIAHLPVLDLDSGTAMEWAMLLTELKRRGRAMPIKDSLVAATARQHKLAVATRNVTDFAHAGVRIVNPFSG
jgi:predicted nucleic acid-binding protein